MADCFPDLTEFDYKIAFKKRTSFLLLLEPTDRGKGRYHCDASINLEWGDFNFNFISFSLLILRLY